MSVEDDVRDAELLAIEPQHEDVDDDFDRDFEPIPLHRRAFDLAVRGRNVEAIADELDVDLSAARSLITDGGRVAALDDRTRLAIAHGVLDEVARKVAAQAADAWPYGDGPALLAVLVDAQRARLDLIRQTNEGNRP